MKLTIVQRDDSMRAIKSNYCFILHPLQVIPSIPHPASHTTLTGTYTPLHPGVRHAMLALTWSKNADTCEEWHTKIPSPEKQSRLAVAEWQHTVTFQAWGITAWRYRIILRLTYIVAPTKRLSLLSSVPCWFSSPEPVSSLDVVW